MPNSGSLGQIDNNLLRLPGLMLPRASRVLPGAGGDGGGGRGLLEHRARGAEAGTDQGRHVLPTSASHHQGLGMVLASEIFGSNSWRL